MNTYTFLDGIEMQRLRRLLLLTILWFAGLSAGMRCAVLFPYNAAHIFSMSVKESLPPFSLCLTVAFPIAVVYVAFTCRAFALCYPLVFAEALCRGFSGVLIYLAPGSGAWRVRMLFLFSASITSVVMWWLLARHAGKSEPISPKDFYTSSVVSGVAAIIDIICISPFLSGFTKYF